MLVHATYICDQTRPDATKCGYACMVGAFVSDFWGCQSIITKIHVYLNKNKFKRCVSHDHNMLSLYGRHLHHRVAAADDLGEY